MNALDTVLRNLFYYYTRLKDFSNTPYIYNIKNTLTIPKTFSKSRNSIYTVVAGVHASENVLKIMIIKEIVYFKLDTCNVLYICKNVENRNPPNVRNALYLHHKDVREVSPVILSD